MFGNLFKKEKKYFHSLVFKSRAPLDHILQLGLKGDQWIVITYFKSTREKLAKNLDPSIADSLLIPAEQIISGVALSKIKKYLSQSGKSIVMAERYPLAAKENRLGEELSLAGITIPINAYSSLDDALFLQFGGEKIKVLMERMGLGEEEVIQHQMIDASLARAQKKLADKVTVDSTWNSPEEWFSRNSLS